MRIRRGQFASLGALAVLAVAVSLSPSLAAGQAGQLAPTKAAAGDAKTAPRTTWGHPDLQGIWTNASSTPFERPSGPAAATRSRDGQRIPGDVGAYNDFWTERGARERGVGEGGSGQTALIVDPPDGKLPALTPAAHEYAEGLEARRRPERPGSWGDLNPFDRCITRGLPGAMIPGFYNHNYQIVQTPEYVAILVEMIHDVRIIPLDGRPHLGPRLRQWMGPNMLRAGRALEQAEAPGAPKKQEQR